MWCGVVWCGIPCRTRLRHRPIQLLARTEIGTRLRLQLVPELALSLVLARLRLQLVLALALVVLALALVVLVLALARWTPTGLEVVSTTTRLHYY